MPRSPGPYSLELSPVGTWQIGMYYYAVHGQLINDRSKSVAVKAGEVIHLNLTVAYEAPAAEGTVTLSGAPADFNSEAYMGV